MMDVNLLKLTITKQSNNTTSLDGDVYDATIDKDVKYTLNSPAVTTHLSIISEIINRLANNSNYCKTICVAIVAAFAVFTPVPKWNDFVIWCLPLFAVCLLDSLFVFHKLQLTEQSATFVSDINKGKQVRPFQLEKTSICQMMCGTIRCLFNASVWLFYGAMILTLLLHILLK